MRPTARHLATCAASAVAIVLCAAAADAQAKQADTKAHAGAAVPRMRSMRPFAMTYVNPAEDPRRKDRGAARPVAVVGADEQT
jgi:hypothetical protein